MKNRREFIRDLVSATVGTVVGTGLTGIITKILHREPRVINVVFNCEGTASCSSDLTLTVIKELQNKPILIVFGRNIAPKTAP